MKVMQFFDKLTRNVPNEGQGANPDPAAQTDAQPDPTPAEAAQPDYSWMGDFAKDGAPDFDGFKSHYQDLIADQAARQEAEPKVPEAYDFSLPDDFDTGVQLPEGVKIEIDTADPLYGELGDLLKQHKVPQELAGELPKMLARYQAQQYAELHKAATADYETLGATDAVRDARVQSVARALDTRLPKDQADALKAATQSAAGVKALEAILGPRSVGTPPASPQAGKLDDPNLTGSALLRAARSQ